MKIAVDISLYPLAEDYIPPIEAVIERLHAVADIEVTTNPMSTQLSGEYDAVMALLTREIRQTFELEDKAVFVMKVLSLGVA